MNKDPDWLDQARREGRVLSDTGVNRTDLDIAQQFGTPVVPMIHRLWIPRWRPARLDTLLFCSVGQRIRLRKADDEMVAFYAKESKIPKAACKRKVSLEIMLKGRQQEVDIDGYQKSTLDSLVNCGQLLGDRAAQAAWGGTTYSRGIKPGTMIVLEDLP